jgi:PST family polysaccharide transporter
VGHPGYDASLGSRVFPPGLRSSILVPVASPRILRMQGRGARLSDNEVLARQQVYAAPPPEAVGRLARIGAKWTVLLLGVRQVIGLGTSAVVCRLIAPDAFGLVAMVTPVTAFLLLVADMGMTWANVQKRDIHWDQVNLLFWIGGLTGVVAWGICIVSSPLIARFFGRSELNSICVVLGASLLLNGLSVQPLALLKRQMRQKVFSLVQTIAAVVAAGVAIAMAAADFGYWALVAQPLTFALVLLILSLQQSGYRPGVPRLSQGMHSLVRFGGYVAACNIVTFFQLYLDNIVIGRYCGAEELGYYSRAYFLRALPAMYAAIAMTDMMVPALVALRADRQRLGAAYRKALRTIAFVGCPLGVLLGVGAPEIVRLIYGPAWGPVAPLLAWLALPAIALPIYHTMSWLFLAAGKARPMFIQSVLVTPVVVLGFFLGVRWGGDRGRCHCGSGLVYTSHSAHYPVSWASHGRD